MKKNELLYTAILATVLTSLTLCFAFAWLSPTKINLLIISCISLAGYMTSYVYFSDYKNSN